MRRALYYLIERNANKEKTMKKIIAVAAALTILFILLTAAGDAFQKLAEDTGARSTGFIGCANK